MAVLSTKSMRLRAKDASRGIHTAYVGVGEATHDSGHKAKIVKAYFFRGQAKGVPAQIAAAVRDAGHAQ